MPKKQIVVNEAGAPTGVIQFTFEDGTVQNVDVNALDEATKFRALVHGVSQKVGDSYAGAKAEENPTAFAKSVCAETIAQILRGEWRAPSAGGGPRVTDLAVALSRATGQALEAAVEFIGTLDDQQTKDLRNKPKIKAVLAAITAEKAAAKAKKLAEEAANAPE